MHVHYGAASFRAYGMLPHALSGTLVWNIVTARYGALRHVTARFGTLVRNM